MCAGFHRVRWALPAFVLWCAAAPPSAAAASTVGEEPQARRIVSLAPSVTETLFALGAGDAVVGISTYCDYPPAATRIDRIGTFLTPNIEAILAKRPDLVIGVPTPGNRNSEFGFARQDFSPSNITELPA